MFEFQNLEVYRKSVNFHQAVDGLLKSKKIAHLYRNQLHRASLSIALNIAEGSGRFTKPDRRNFFIISRSSIFECVALLEMLKNQIPEINSNYDTLLAECDEMSRILYSMIKNLKS